MHGFMHRIAGFIHQFPRGYPQFKKVFLFTAEEIHTVCAQKICPKNFVKLKRNHLGRPVKKVPIRGLKGNI